MSLESSILLKRIITINGCRDNCYLNVKDGVIHSITEKKIFDNEIVDFSNLTAVPGFIDIHTHGYFGVDATYSSEEEIHRWAQMLARKGITSFIPTCVSLPLETMIKFINKIRSASLHQKEDEARILGMRSEGPYISLEQKGAHNPLYLRRPDIDELRKIIQAAGSSLFIIDMAPELENFRESLEYLLENNKVVSIGHSNASYSQATAGIDSGARLMTHFFNAMSPLKHREAGMVGAGLLSDSVYLELIGDMHHVSREAIKILLKTRDIDHIIGITDSLSIGGTTSADAKLGGLDVIKKDGVAWIRDTNTIAGSILTMDTAFQNLHEIVSDPVNLTKIFSTNASKALSLKNIGYIDVGMDADINIIDDHMKVKGTMIRGCMIGDVK
ncbi:N-acetylglucosamine-6-phosphate deacetylase [Cuniculiplasma divulgatum]|uniref:N-acetylglucosamine-6-phosphate deacetylase n=1 Tax=Cuniculiplasma divulgatum TaxID=1673428 RepID=A0A1N5W7N8_9ARCH|nr:N-acetylglucosamine-6-phosphate deacetylase [Cuniculiplasma divulgatum]MCI2413076.1 N-acetylglucosamine-6-phosphate deacetylase [Cuniculiplasma sp.]SIM80317.1 N-acetylglucosamine-6-phosphate deacetylase [Cuniculiplasma divulgatum]